jgi:5-methylcytosine-specific restriction endonuclease McrBC regulatory subunit McrC
MQSIKYPSIKNKSMEKYLNQLIENMQQAAKNLPAKPYLELSEDDECLRGVIEYESIEPKPMQ